MSSSVDAIINYYNSYYASIPAGQAAKTASTTDPKQAILAAETNFNTMLMSLLDNPDDTNNDSTSNDPFAGLYNSSTTGNSATTASNTTTASTTTDALSVQQNSYLDITKL